MIDLTQIDLTELTNDGDTLELLDGRMLRLRIEPDQDYHPFEDQSDFYGKLAPVRRSPYYEGGDQRPSDFDGNAEKISLMQNGGTYWWQPPPEPKRSDPGFREWRALIIELASYGGVGVILELLEGTDAYDRPIVRETTSLWSIDSLADGYLAKVVKELAEELAAQSTTG